MLVFFWNSTFMECQGRNLALIWPLKHCGLGQKLALWFQCSKTQLFSFDRSNNYYSAIDKKMNGSPLQERSCFNMLRLSFFPQLDWDSYIVFNATTISQKIKVLICSMKFLSSEIALYPYKSTKPSCMENYCHIWSGVPRCYLYMLNKLQKLIRRTLSSLLSFSLDPLANYFGGCSSELVELVPLPDYCGRSTHYSNTLHDFCHHS